jgi:hypothetical protein
MRQETRLQLKQPTGWFAAGREVACALALLSDATFKLFVWLCLHAERSQGVLSATRAEIARALGKKESEIHLALQELERQGVCILRGGGVLEIRDHFWPYQRKADSTAPDQPRRYVETVKRLFLERRCVQSSFTAADEKLALSLYHRGLSLTHVERAILLGALRKYVAVRQNGRGTPISSLHYFTNLFEEVQQEISTSYWTYVANKVNTFEQKWAGFTSGRPKTREPGETGDAVGRPSGESSL